MKIGPNMPSDDVILENAILNSYYAKIAQKYGMVPIVEPDVSSKGTHSVQECMEKCQRIYSTFITHLLKKNVDLGGILIKTNMITPGFDFPGGYNDNEVGEHT